MITVRTASHPGDPTRPNEDAVIATATGGLVAVFDGVSSQGVESGCRHGPAWYATRLATHVAAGHITSPTMGLSDLLAHAIEAVRGEHGSTCDLDHPGTPQSTVAILRIGETRCDYLLLSDRTIVLDSAGTLTAVTDLRIRQTAQSARRLALSGGRPIGSESHTERLRALTLAKRQHVN